MPDDFDSPWKDILEAYFPDFMASFLPAAAEIDWSRSFEFKQQILDLYRFIDWVLQLPKALELRYTDAIYQIEESKNMPYLSFVERRGEARGEARGFSVMLRGQLEQRFGPLSNAVIERLDAADADQLLAWSRRVLDAPTLDEVFADDA
jgi:hypothetical protein